MKNLFFFTALPCLLAAVPLTSPAQQPATPLPLVTTTGSAEIKVVPDLVDLSFQVETRNADLDAARKEQSDRAAKILAALRATGVEEKDLSSEQAEISPDYSDGQKQSTNVRFYRVKQGFNCTLHEVNKLPEVTTAAITAGVNMVGLARLRTSESRKHKDTARRMAVIAAREKAVALAKELGAKAGRPYSITEIDGITASRYQSQFMNSSSGLPSEIDTGDNLTFAAGVISVSATVNVSFVLE